MSETDQTCANCAFAEPGTIISGVVFDFRCKWKPGKKVSRYDQACLVWGPKEGRDDGDGGEK